MRPLFTLSKKSKLPYDAEIEWLANKSTSSNPSEFIDTGWFCDYDKGFRIEVVCCIKTLQRRYSLVSNYDCEHNMALELYSFPCTIRGYCQNYNFFNTSGDSLTKDQFFTVKLEYYDGIVKTYNDDYVNQSNKILSGYSSKTALMFVDQEKRFDTFADQLKIAACKIYDGHELFRDFIPVRVGQVGYMYDRVSGKLFGNSGTGSFVLGPDVKTFGCMTTKNKRQSGVWDMIARAKRAVNYTAKDYIQDGLVYHFDAIEFNGYGDTSDGDGTWVELVQNRKSGEYNDYVVRDGDTVKILKTNSNALLNGGGNSVYHITDIFNAGNWTAEVVATAENNTLFGFYDNSPSSYGWKVSCIKIYSEHAQFHAGLQETTVIDSGIVSDKFNKYTLSKEGSVAKCFINGQLVATLTGCQNIAPNLVGGYMYAGSSYKTSMFYNRALSEDEIRHNYMVDKRRFGI